MGDTTFSVRDAELRDAGAIARVHVESWRTTYAGVLPQAMLDALDVEERRTLWTRIIEGAGKARQVVLVLAREPAGEVVGFASAGPARNDAGASHELYAIYLLASAQRSGGGTALFREVVRRLREAGARSLMLWVASANAAEGFYAAMGGRAGRRRTDEIDKGVSLAETEYRWDSLP